MQDINSLGIELKTFEPSNDWIVIGYSEVMDSLQNEGLPVCYFTDTKGYAYCVPIAFEKDEHGNVNMDAISFRVYRQNMENGDISMLEDGNKWSNAVNEDAVIDEEADRIFEKATPLQKLILKTGGAESDFLIEMIMHNNGEPITDEYYQEQKTKNLALLIEAADRDDLELIEDEKGNFFLRGIGQYGYLIGEHNGRWTLYQYFEPDDATFEFENNEEMYYQKTSKTYKRIISSSDNPKELEALLDDAPEVEDYMLVLPLSKTFCVYSIASPLDIDDLENTILNQKDHVLTKREQNNLEAFCDWYRENIEKKYRK